MKYLVILALTLVFFLAPFCLAQETPSYITIQRIKNLTQNDKDEGGNITRGIGGDSLRFLIFFENRNEQAIDNLNILDILPKFIDYTNGTAYIYRSDNPTWQKVEDSWNDTSFPLDGSGLDISSFPAKSWLSIKFQAQIQDVLPTEDLIFTNLNVAYNKDEELARDVTSLLIPNRNTSLASKEISVEEAYRRMKELAEKDKKKFPYFEVISTAVIASLLTILLSLRLRK